MRWVKRMGYGLLGLAALGTLAVWWLFLETHTAPAGPWAVDLARVRALAGQAAGPQALRIETVVHLAGPRNIVMAGDGWQSIDLPVSAYELVWPDHTAVVDTGMDAATATAMGATSFDPAAYARMSDALRRAALILVTHEHPDHIAGLLAQPQVQALLGKTRLTREQVDEVKANLRQEPFDHLHLPAGLFDGYRPLPDQRYQAVAPGVVLIRAPGHTPGSQMVYVRRADGAEFLLLGDVAWRTANVEQQREKGRITAFVAGEDRATVRQELAGLHDLHRAAPALHMMGGHDADTIAAWERAGLLAKGF